jgi:hypothetical protein
LTLNIRKKDGTTVSLDFKCPALRRASPLKTSLVPSTLRATLCAV